MRTSFTDRLPLSRSAVDRDAAGRDRPGALDAAWSDEATRVVVLSRGRALLTQREPQPRLALLPPSALPRPDLLLYLGRLLADAPDAPVGTPVLAAELAEDEVAALGVLDDRWADLRLDGAAMDSRDAGLFTEALGLANWHRSHAHSPRTGAPTVPGRSGWVRHPEGFEQESSGEHVFPRTDPAVIVGVVDPADRLLLASNAAWPDGRYSVVAGFVEPGESFEMAVRREVHEETGVAVADMTYLGSQPWPFPASIMVGFRAEAVSGDEPVPDGEEIRDARWFSRDELRAGLADGLKLPGRTSIARAIIEQWFGEELEADW